MLFFFVYNIPDMIEGVYDKHFGAGGGGGD